MGQIHCKIDHLVYKWQEMLDFTEGYYPHSGMGKQGSKYAKFIYYLKNNISSFPKHYQNVIFKLPFAEQWLTLNAVEAKAVEQWNEVLNYTLNKYGFHKMPLPSVCSREKELYWIIYGHRRRILQTGKTYDCIYELPMAKFWLDTEGFASTAGKATR